MQFKKAIIKSDITYREFLRKFADAMQTLLRAVVQLSGIRSRRMSTTSRSTEERLFPTTAQGTLQLYTPVKGN